MNGQSSESSALVPQWGHDQISRLALHGTLQNPPSSVALASIPFSTATSTTLSSSQLFQQMCFLQNQQSTENSFDPATLNNNNNNTKIADSLVPVRSMEVADTPMGQDETAQLLLRFSQNVSRTPTASTATNSPCPTPSTPTKTQKRTFFRAPGLEAPSAAEAGESGGLVCPVCSFGCTSRFHYNSHMNTHGCHRCQVPSCNYTSRTEGRLKKHMMDSHTAEQRKSVGFKVSNRENNNNDRLSNALDQMKALTEGGPVPDSPPQRRPSVKPKRYKCKHCDHISTNRDERYMHSKIHIPVEKQLTCPHCEFVTEYKHHMTYHMKNHAGAKPFKCNKCEYTCVNKSMLNSHMKSHVPLYQFKCRDCTYQTKYCHSLKMHIFKYNHERDPGAVGTEEEEAALMDEALGEAMETESKKNVDPPSLDCEPKEINFNCNDKAGDPPLPAPQPVQSNLLLQPLLNQNNHSFQIAQQLLFPPERMQELVRAASNMLQRHKCDHCEFTTLSSQELAQHNLNHFYNQKQQYTNMINLLVQQQQQQQSQSMLTADLLRNTLAMKPQELRQDTQSSMPELKIEPEAEAIVVNSPLHRDDEDEKHSNSHKSMSPTREEAFDEAHDRIASTPLHEATSPSAECSASPSDSHKSMDNVSSRGSPNSSTTTTHSSNKKGSKVDEISERLQRKTTPDSEDRTSPNDTDPHSSYIQGQEHHQGEDKSRFSVLLNQLNSAHGAKWPHTCQHCMVAFQDRALYQIHIGYHTYESPFKCNRCGHEANSSMEFTLHLYHAKH
ncbi:unnamed protein product [Bursaphelenchus xylophilus]|uniref:(pine wood nematode) hypothetical protein n=1 Tax=Bursaphelenchus xylophilus TaxID=6326 RepID=A0A1I7RQU2_BURXY|nr:unnamed protein product [Bursaphelenchus xylophilus]CAG9130669.1 unnamed protein product [Bursaphelenchus xylophilus]